jgi:pimeloyl-[acyl-carrier protein] methyl ester esterase
LTVPDSTLAIVMRNRPSVAILSGWATRSEIWQSTNQSLVQRGCDVTVFEYRGYGLRESEAPGESFDQLIEDASEKLHDCSIWIGWSLGALVALAVATRNRSRVKGVLAVCGCTKFCFDDHRKVVLEQLTQSVETDHKKSVKRFLMSMPSAKHRRRTLKQLPVDIEIASKATLLSGLKILARADLSDELNKIGVPVKIISGDDDQIIPASAGLILHHQIPHSTFTALPCGHVPFMECPELFTEQLFEFIETITQSQTD